MASHHRRIARLAVAALISGSVLAGCAASQTGSQYGPEPIPEGKGRLFLEAGGIMQLNFYVLDEETGEEVYSDMPRVSAASPAGYESSWQQNRLVVDLDPGTYQVIVNTDVRDDVVVPEVVVTMGQETHKRIGVGRFMVLFTGGDQFGAQMPFLIMDYGMRTVLGKGITSSQVKHVIVPEGRYKIRMEQISAGLDEMRDVDVVFGRVTPVRIDVQTEQEEQSPTVQP